MIGIILALTAVVLAIECKGLLIGEAADETIIASIEALTENHEYVESINEILTMHFGPSDILLNLSLDFKKDIYAGDVENMITKFEIQIKEKHPDIKRIFIEAQSFRGHQKNALSE